MPNKQSIGPKQTVYDSDRCNNYDIHICVLSWKNTEGILSFNLGAASDYIH